MVQFLSMLEIDNLACLKGDRLLFRNLSLRLSRGDMLRISGHNGIGKTSLLRVLCGLSLAEQGEIRWQGQDIRRHRETFYAALLYLGHSAAINDLLSPLENLLFNCRVAGDAVSGDTAKSALYRMGLAGQMDLPAGLLSQGQRRRVGLARLFLASQRGLWIVDEPFNALDIQAISELSTMLTAHCSEGGIVILTTHQDVAFATPPRQLDLAELVP